MRLGVKSSARTHSLGHKSKPSHSLGQKRSDSVVMSGMNTSKSLSSTPESMAGVGSSNMIYNKSNLGDIQYYPLGRKTLNIKKSYLEKR